MSITSIKVCSCKHADQDRRYGPQYRVHNATKKGGKAAGSWRCTVCGSAKN